MIPIICKTCGNLLADKEIFFIKEIEKIMKELDINDQTIFENKNNIIDTFIEKKSNCINNLLNNYCCKIIFLTYTDYINLDS